MEKRFIVTFYQDHDCWGRWEDPVYYVYDTKLEERYTCPSKEKAEILSKILNRSKSIILKGRK